MSNLRKRIIRLAHEKPELRPQLLPLLKEGAAAKWIQVDAQSAENWLQEKLGSILNSERRLGFVDSVICQITPTTMDVVIRLDQDLIEQRLGTQKADADEWPASVYSAAYEDYVKGLLIQLKKDLPSFRFGKGLFLRGGQGISGIRHL